MVGWKRWGLLDSLSGNDAVPGKSLGGPPPPLTRQAGSRVDCIRWALGWGGRGEGGSAQYLVASSVTLGSFWGQPTARNKVDNKCTKENNLKVAKNAETPFEQRVLPPQRGSLQGGRSHTLRRLLHMCSSPSCSDPSCPGPT